MAVDAFTLTWTDMEAYTFPEFCLISRVLVKVSRDKATVVLITPSSQTQPWYSTLLEMSVELPILLPNCKELLVDPSGQPHPLLLSNQLRLSVWKVSGVDAQIADFWRTLPTYSCSPDERELRQLTMVPGKRGLAGAIQDSLIHFRPLWSVWQIFLPTKLTGALLMQP